MCFKGPGEPGCVCTNCTVNPILAQALRSAQQQLYSRIGPGGASGAPRFEWCLLLDNSGSMASKAHGAKMATALLMEVLRRVECPFAVVTFGRKQQVGTVSGFSAHPRARL